MSKHRKTTTPSDADLRGNPLIGCSKGIGRPREADDDLEALAGENTLEGDRDNDVNRQGGIDKAAARGGHPQRRD